jgi:hypothetical protein
LFDVRLKTTEKSGIYLLVQQSGLNLANFAWADEESEEWIDTDSLEFKISVLTHRPTGYYCKFGGTQIEYSPGPDQRVETVNHRDRWAVKSGVTQVWLEELRREVDAPDLWATIGQEKVLSTAAASTALDNRPLTAAEQSLIAAKLDEIKAYLLQGQQFAAEEAETVEREFIYLRESSERLGKKDWLNNLLGGLVGLAIGLALDPEKARGLLRLAGAVFQSLWGTGHNLLP